MALFFNYHEYSVTWYADRGQGASYDHQTSLVVTHFPNIHAPLGSHRYESTRIVRVPRAFHTANVALYPQFSLDMPGTEAAAERVEGEDTFVPRGAVDGQWFGYSSASVLSENISEERYKEIIEEVNMYMKRAFYTFQWANFVWCLLDFVSCWTLSMWFRDPSKRALDELEGYIEEVNEGLVGVKIVSPRRSAYLTIDFEVPRPGEMRV